MLLDPGTGGGDALDLGAVAVSAGSDIGRSWRELSSALNER